MALREDHMVDMPVVGMEEVMGGTEDFPEVHSLVVAEQEVGVLEGTEAIQTYHTTEDTVGLFRDHRTIQRVLAGLWGMEEPVPEGTLESVE